MESVMSERIARREAVLDGIRGIVIERLLVEREPDEIDPGTPLFGTGLGLDSVDAVELVISLEERFGVQIPDGEETRRAMRTLDSLADYILERGGRG
jgi:acyl carrier protein